MKFKMLFGLVASFLLACISICAFAQKEAVKEKSQAQTHFVVNEVPAVAFLVVNNTTVNEAGPGISFGPAVHQNTLYFIATLTGQRLPLYNRKAPRTGSYYYLMGEYWNCFKQNYC